MFVNKCPDIALEPEEKEAAPLYCPVCGEELEDYDMVRFYKGRPVGCDSCLDKYPAYLACGEMRYG